MFHEAALASVPRSVADPAGTNLHCVTATLNLLVAARAAGVRRVVYAGSSSAYGDTPTLPKARGDAAQTDFALRGREVGRRALYAGFLTSIRARNRGPPLLQCLWALPGSHIALFGSAGDLLPKMLAGEQPTIYGNGEQSRDFTYIDNVVHGNLLAADAPAEKVSGRMMNLATSSRITLNETFRILRDLTGHKGEPAYAEPRSGDIRDSLADIGWRASCWGTDRS